MSAEAREALCARYPGARFGPGVQILGLDSVAIGEGTTIAEDSWLNVCTRDGRPRMRIGRCCYVGRRAVLNTAGRLELGDYCLLGPGVYVGDADHDFADITRPYVEQAVSGERSVLVEENCWLGAGVVVSGALTVGRGSVLAAGAVVLRDVLPFSLVAGVPARVVKLYNPLTRAWEQAGGEAEQARILEARARSPLPGREEYAALLRKNSTLRGYDPVLDGGGQCL